MNVVDNTPPAIGALPIASTVTGSAIPSCPTPTGGDVCSTVTLTFADATAAGSCANNYSVTRTWTAKDACNNTATASQTINVVDNTPPTIGALPSASTVTCPATPSFTTPTASDACSTVTLTFADVTTAGSCANNYSVKRTWTAIDGCGNSATASQTISVIDNTPPTIGTITNSTINCPATPTFIQPTASDACNTATVQQVGSDVTVTNTCGYTVTRTWRAVDACGNQSGTVAQTITVTDTTPPTIGISGSNGTISCTATPNFVPPTASDACSGATVNILGDVTGGNSCAKTITRSWDATDVCGNHSTIVSQTITLIDNVPPTIGSSGANGTINCTGTPAFAAPTASDACNGATLNFLGDVTAVSSCARTVTRSWDATDACGNHSVSTSQTISLVDNTPPTIGTAGANGTTNCTSTPSFTAPTATDACNGATVNNLGDVTGGTSCAKTITRSWDASDACGNHSATVSQTITVVDNLVPVITCPPPQTFCAVPGNNYTIPPLVASDNCSATLTISFQITGVTSRSGSGNDASGIFNVGVSTITWTVNDGCGNTATCTATVNVTSNPVVTADDKQVCVDGSVTLTGQPTGGVWSGAHVSGSVFSAIGLAAGSYSVTYTYTQGSCNGSATATIT